MTFLPKIHGPVSMTRKLPPASYVASSTLPLPPSRASTLKPVRSLWVDIPSRNVQMSMRVAIRPPLVGHRFPYPTVEGHNPQARIDGLEWLDRECFSAE